jgi:antitoxin MazE
MQTAIRKIGNSSGIVLPKPVLAHLRLSTGDMIDLDLEDGRVVISPVPRHPREGWAAAAAALAETGDDQAVWPVFANLGDEDL